MPNNVPEPEYPSNVEDIFRDTAIWEWISGETEAPDEDTFTAEDSLCYMEGWLKDRTFLTDALAYFIGYSYVDPSDPNKLLNRKLPAFSPRWKWDYCNRVQIKGVKSTGQDTEANASTGLPEPTYERYRFRVYFEGLPYVVRSDEDVDFDGSGEFGRFLTIDSEDASELFVQEGGSYTYVDTTVGSKVNGKPLLGAGLRVYAERENIIITAYQIAHDLILDDWGFPRKFQIARNKVNSLSFMGKPAGTMLLKHWGIKKTPQPIATQDNGKLLFGLRITMKFGYTDPPRADPAETHRGWQLAPGFDETTFSGWFYVKNADNKSLYDEVDMNQLLTHQSFTTGGF